MRWPDTILTRAILILAGALLALHVVGYWAYSIGAEGLATKARDRALSERIISIKKAIDGISDDRDRDRAAHDLGSSSLDVHWSRVSLIIGNAPSTDRSRAVGARLRELAPDFAAEAFRVGYADDGALASGDTEAYRHMMLVSIRLTDSSWINFASPTFGTTHWLTSSSPVLALCFGLAIVVVAILLLRWVTRPLRELAWAAERFNLDTQHQSLSEDGPAEVRRAARAFNAMDERIRRLVKERVQALAAVSHDLRTPIARLRLRAEMFEDEDMRGRVNDDLTEMETMINSTLEFLKFGTASEPNRAIDLAALLQTLVDDARDRRGAAVLTGEPHAILQAQPVTLKRAFENLIGNASKFGDQVEVAIGQDNTHVTVRILDNGPGIPDDQMERVFEPFYRLEGSRNRGTGGTGLGLTIARQIILSHGGSIELANRQVGGLEVVVRLPKSMVRPYRQSHAEVAQ